MRRLPVALTLSALALLATGCAAARPVHGLQRQTDRNLDLAVDGDGYFIVQTMAGGFLFTRVGELAMSGSGELVNGDGYRLYPPVSIPDGSTSITITPDGVVRREVPNGVPELVGQIVLSRFEHAGKLERDGVYYLPTPESGDPITGKPSTKGLGTIRVGQLED